MLSSSDINQATSTGFNDDSESEMVMVVMVTVIEAEQEWVIDQI